MSELAKLEAAFKAWIEAVKEHFGENHLSTQQAKMNADHTMAMAQPNANGLQDEPTPPAEDDKPAA